MIEHPQARFIIDTLHRAGFIAYYAGGWVRDFLLNHPSDDIDIATNAAPQTVQTLFPHTVPIGISFGIILVIIDEHQFEVATFRQDLDYRDGRRPSRVEFTTAKEDAKRRDFTINGMFFDPIHNEVLDYVGGKDDLQKKIIRAIGDPHERIKEDRLRMIRAIRLACRFHFEIEEKTQKAIRAHAKELFPAVAIERIVQELQKGLAFNHLSGMLLMLHQYDLLSSIFPELAHIADSEIKKRLEPISHYPSTAPLIAYLLVLFPNFTIDEQLLLSKKLKFSNTDQQFIIYLHQFFKTHQQDQLHPQQIENVEWAHIYSNPLYSICLEIVAAHVESSHRKAFFIEHEKRNHLLKRAVDSIQNHTPIVTSSDLKNAGIEPGKTMGVLLKEAERIACNELIFDSHLIVEKLKKTPAWPQ